VVVRQAASYTRRCRTTLKGPVPLNFVAASGESIGQAVIADLPGLREARLDLRLVIVVGATLR